MTRETWYVLEDGSAVHPSEVSMSDDGRLAHKFGLVAIRPDGETPLSRGVDVDEDGKRPFSGKGDHDNNGSEGGAKKTTDMRAEKPAATAPKKPYKTRQSKAR